MPIKVCLTYLLCCGAWWPLIIFPVAILSRWRILLSCMNRYEMKTLYSYLLKIPFFFSFKLYILQHFVFLIRASHITILAAASSSYSLLLLTSSTLSFAKFLMFSRAVCQVGIGKVALAHGSHSVGLDLYVSLLSSFKCPGIMLLRIRL